MEMVSFESGVEVSMLFLNGTSAHIRPFSALQSCGQ